MAPAGKILMLMGGLLLLAGAALWLLARIGFRGLPGDVRYHGEHVSFYFPVVTGMVLSVLATLILWIWQWLSRR